MPLDCQDEGSYYSQDEEDNVAAGQRTGEYDSNGVSRRRRIDCSGGGAAAAAVIVVCCCRCTRCACVRCFSVAVDMRWHAMAPMMRIP